MKLIQIILLACVATIAGCQDGQKSEVATKGAEKNTQEKPLKSHTTKTQKSNKQQSEVEKTAEQNAKNEKQHDPSTRVAADNPDANLAASDKLQADTLEAAKHDRTKSKIAYIGVWAASAPGCAKIDQDVYDSFAVITPSQVRQFEEVCAIKAAPLTSNTTILEARCSAEGETRKGTIRIEMLNGQSMMFSHGDGKPYPLYRCHLKY